MPEPRFNWALLFILAAIQLTHIIDFMMMIPLGPRYQREMELSPADFGLLVSVYAFAAGISGLFVASFIDRYDRKRAMLFLYAGFTVGTLGCALASNYSTLLLARATAGAFGGVINAVTLAIIGDSFPERQRGLATGVVMAAFSVATIVGVPIGLELANHWGTTAPFGSLAGFSALLLVSAAFLLPSMKEHLNGDIDRTTSQWKVLLDTHHLRIYAFMTSLVLGSFLLIPQLAIYLVSNLGFPERDLGLMYLCGGLATIVSMPLIGRISDRVGKLPIFRLMAFLTILHILWMTNLSQLPREATLAITTLFMVLTSGRMVPAMAMITSSARPAYRGSVMSMNSAVQQFAAGFSSWIAGVLLDQPVKDGPLIGYPLVGILASVAAVVSLVLAGHIRAVEEELVVSEPLAAL